MKILARPRGTNKTKELLELADAANGLVLTTEKRALKVKADAYGLKNVDTVDWSDLIYGNYDNTRPLYIHKAADVFAQYLKSDFNLDLNGFSVTMEDS